MAPRSKQVPCLRCASQVWADRENWEMILQGQCCGQQYGSSRVSDANMGHGFELQALGFCLCIAKSPSPLQGHLNQSPWHSYGQTLLTYLLRAQSPEPGHWEVSLGTRTVSEVSL